MACPSLPRTVTTTRALPASVALREVLSALVDARGAFLDVTGQRDVVESWFADNDDRCYAHSTDAYIAIYRRADQLLLALCKGARP